MDFEFEARKAALDRLATLVRSGLLTLGLLGVAATGYAANWLFQEIRPVSTTMPEQLQNAEAALYQARDALKFVQSFAGEFDSFLDEVARTSGSLPDPKVRAVLVQETQAYKSLMNDVNAKILAALNNIGTYEANRPRQHSSTSILSIAALAQTPPAPSPMSSIDSLRPMIMIGVIIAITVFFFICVGLFCFAADADKLKFADNMMRTIIGFYIGIVTGLLGLPGK